jgi:uncharacterized repeat protein (TIGR03943 family)
MSARSDLHDHRAGARADRSARVVLLAALGALLLAKWRAGALDLYVHPGFVPVLALAGGLLLALAAAQLRALARTAAPLAAGADERALSWGMALLVLAVVVGALVPARPLGSAAAASQTAELPPPALLPLSDETESWTLLEWAQALGGGVRRERLIGRPVSVVGFVYRPRQGAVPGEIQVTRFVVRCCAADGLAVSLPVRHPDADSLAADTWVKVEGALRVADERDRTAVFVEADRLTVVPAPATPYLTPS